MPVPTRIALGPSLTAHSGSAKNCLEIQLAYVVGDGSNSQQSTSDGQCELEAVDAKEVFAEYGVTYATRNEIMVDKTVLQTFNTARCQTPWMGLPADVKQAIQGVSPSFELVKERTRAAYTVRTTRPIQQGKAVLQYTGTLWTESEWEAHGPDASDKAQLFAYDIPAKQFKGYQGPDLVLAGHLRGREGAFLQDPTWWDWDAEPNLQAQVVWTATPDQPEQVLPHILFYSTRDIKSGEELLLDWGDKCWQALSRIESLNQAAESWQLYYTHRRLEDLCKNYGVALAGPSGASSTMLNSTSAKRRMIVFDRAQKRYRLDDTYGAMADGFNENLHRSAPGVMTDRPKEEFPPPADVYHTLSETEVQNEAFDSRTMYRASCDYSALPPQLIKQMNKVPQNSKRTHTRSSIQNPTHIQQLTEYELELIRSGAMPSCSLVEVMALHHSVRWFTPPDNKAYSVVANKVVEKGEPLGIFCGDFSLGRDSGNKNYEKQEYAFELSVRDLKAACPHVRWSGPMLVDAIKHGNESRFLNDSWGREAVKQNVEGKVVWDPAGKRPYIMLYAQTKINKGEELLLDYGPNYWRYFGRHLQRIHAEYFNKMSSMIGRMVAQLKQQQHVPAGQLAECMANIDLDAKRLYTE